MNEYPHRRWEIRNLAPYFVCSGDEDLINRYASAIRAFPENLPLSYEEEKAHEAHLNALREKMTLFSEQGDPAQFCLVGEICGSLIRSNGGRELGSRSPRTRCGIARLQRFAVRSQLPFEPVCPLR